nr:DUF6214 family protein [Streptomyces canus]
MLPGSHRHGSADRAPRVACVRASVRMECDHAITLRAGGKHPVDTLAVVAEDGVSLEDVRTQPALT